MGFYGNITNTARTQFVFDRIYESRTAMDTYAPADQVYAGKFVLVEYDSSFSNSVHRRAYRDAIDTLNLQTDETGAARSEEIKLYSDNECENVITIKTFAGTDGLAGVRRGSIFYVLEDDGTFTYYECTSTDSTEDDEEALFKIWENSASEIPNYIKNYNDDLQNYPDCPQGFDSTVWMKMFIGSEEKYVQIASLNTIMPSFGISADAPTTSASIPHFDPCSNNMYYQLHIQPTWGLRVKAAQGDLLSTENENTPSDEKTTWIQTSLNENGIISYYYYDEENSGWVKMDNLTDIPQVSAAIYYNKAGFDPAARYHSSLSDKIDITPTGYSQRIIESTENILDENDEIVDTVTHITAENVPYNKHDGTGTTQFSPDTQEISMMLPSIGNAISDMWDVVYGTGVEEVEYEDLAIELTGRTNTDVTLDNGRNPVFMRLDDFSASGYSYVEETAELGTTVIYEADGYDSLDSPVYTWYYNKWHYIGDESNYPATISIINSPFIDENGEIANDIEIPRNMDLDWDSKAGLRLIKYNEETDKYEYNISRVKTLAGAINSVHDLMGMIIVSKDDISELTTEEIQALDADKIYYNEADNKFYRKHLGYLYTLINDEEKEALLHSQYTKIYFDAIVGDAAHNNNNINQDNIPKLFYQNVNDALEYIYDYPLYGYNEEQLYFEATKDVDRELDFSSNEAIATYYRTQAGGAVSPYWYDSANHMMKPITEDSLFFPVNYYTVAESDALLHYIYAPGEYKYDQTEDKVVEYLSQKNAVASGINNSTTGIILSNIYNNYSTTINAEIFDQLINEWVFGLNDTDFQNNAANTILVTNYGPIGNLPQEQNGAIDLIHNSIFTDDTEFEIDLQNSLEAFYSGLCHIQNSNTVVPRYKYDLASGLTVGDSAANLYVQVDCALPVKNIQTGVEYYTVSSESATSAYIYDVNNRRYEYYDEVPQTTVSEEPGVEPEPDTGIVFSLNPTVLTDEDLEELTGEEEFYVLYTSYKPAEGLIENDVNYFEKDSTDYWSLQNRFGNTVDRYVDLGNITNLYNFIKVLIEILYYYYNKYNQHILTLVLDERSSMSEITYYHKTTEQPINTGANEGKLIDYINGIKYYLYDNETHIYTEYRDSEDLTPYTEYYVCAGGNSDLDNINDITFESNTLTVTIDEEDIPVDSTLYYTCDDYSTPGVIKYKLNQNDAGFIAGPDPSNNKYSVINWSPALYRIEYTQGKFLRKELMNVTTEQGVVQRENYVLDLNPSLSQGVDYYIFEPLYYLGADFYPYTQGQLLNNSAILSIPNLENVPVATRATYPELIPIEGFAVNLNTIHGLILKINQMLDYGNTLTRDQSTVQGAINSLNDEVARISNYNIEYVNTMSNTLNAMGTAVSDVNVLVYDTLTYANETREKINALLDDIGRVDLMDDRIDELEKLVGVTWVEAYEPIDIDEDNFASNLGNIYKIRYTYSQATEYDTEEEFYYNKIDGYAKVSLTLDDYTANKNKAQRDPNKNYYVRIDAVEVTEENFAEQTDLYFKNGDDLYEKATTYQIGIAYYTFSEYSAGAEWDYTIAYIKAGNNLQYYQALADTIETYYFISGGGSYEIDSLNPSISYVPTREYFVKMPIYQVMADGTVNETNYQNYYVAEKVIDVTTKQEIKDLVVSPAIYNPDTTYYIKVIIDNDAEIDYDNFYDINDKFFPIQNLFYGKRYNLQNTSQTVIEIENEIRQLTALRDEYIDMRDQFADKFVASIPTEATIKQEINQKNININSYNSSLSKLAKGATITYNNTFTSITKISYSQTNHSKYCKGTKKDNGSIAYAWHWWKYNQSRYDKAKKTKKKKRTKAQKNMLKGNWYKNNVTKHKTNYGNRKTSYLSYLTKRANAQNEIAALQYDLQQKIWELNDPTAAAAYKVYQQKVTELNTQIEAKQALLDSANSKDAGTGEAVDTNADLIDMIYDLYNYCFELDQSKFGIYAEDSQEGNLTASKAMQLLSTLATTFGSLNAFAAGLDIVNSDLASKYDVPKNSAWAIALLQLIPKVADVKNDKTYKITAVKADFKKYTKFNYSSIEYSGTVVQVPLSNTATLDMAFKLNIPAKKVIKKGTYIPIGQFKNGPYRGRVVPLSAACVPGASKTSVRNVVAYLTSNGTLVVRCNTNLGSKKTKTSYAFRVAGSFVYTKGYSVNTKALETSTFSEADVTNEIEED